MFVESLKLNNFRNYQVAEINLSSGINLITGLNAQGKTNLAEALVFLSRAKSPRTHQDKDLIKLGETNANISAKLNKHFGQMSFNFSLFNAQENEYRINGNACDRVGQVFGNLICIYFCPQDLKIVAGSPENRRDYVDDEIMMLSEAYYNLLARYEKVLAQRNKLLKTEKDHAKIIDTIGVWDESLASVACLIIKTRKSFLEKLGPVADKFLKTITDGKDSLKISYVGAKGTEKDEIKKQILKELDENLSRDMELGYTSVGPHRDDVKFELNGLDTKIYASQGQTRSIVLALKLAEMEILKEELNDYPIMIFDDVFSELDNKRQQKIYEALDGVQAIFTGTNFKFKPSGEYKQFKISGGNIKELKVKVKSGE